MAIYKISQEKINQIKQKSVITLPNQPKISAEELKARFVKPITDTTNSTIAEINRIVDEVNDDIETANNLLLDHDADELAHENIREEIDANKLNIEILEREKVQWTTSVEELDHTKGKVGVVIKGNHRSEIYTYNETEGNWEINFSNYYLNTSAEFPYNEITDDQVIVFGNYNSIFEPITTLYITFGNFKKSLGVLIDNHEADETAHNDIRQDIATIQNIITSIDGETDADTVINKLHEIVALLNGYAEGTTLIDLLSGKVDKVPGKSLISDTEISRLENVDNYDDTEVRGLITDLDNAKVNKVPGKSLISDAEIARLAGVDNYDDTEVRGLITALDADKADVIHTHSNYTTEDAVQTKINTHNSSETSHTDIRNSVAEAKAIAEGKVSAMSFETKEDLDAWLLIPENVETLLVGTNFYIEDLASPDYWWNGTTLVELSTDKIDLKDYVKSDDLATVATTGSYNDLTNTPTIPTIPDISLNDNQATAGKYISKIEVDATDKHKLVITKADLPQGFSGNYNDLTNKPTIPTVPTISTNIATDETSDAKTASPKAVKTYVDNAISTALDNLLGGEY